MILKFKAFINATKQIEDVTLIHFDSRLIKVSTGEWYVFEDIIIMQSTGLHDKNGVEIFEGDIVKYLDGEFSYRGVVEKDTVTNWYVKEICYEEFYEFTGIADYNDKTCRFKVIGNIYENPELLYD